jgi:hypothetical protein
MIGVILFLVIGALAVRVVYGLARPHFWLASAGIVLIGLPFVLLLAAVSPFFR